MNRLACRGKMEAEGKPKMDGFMTEEIEGGLADKSSGVEGWRGCS